MGKAVIILVVGTIINFGLANLNSSNGVNEATRTATDYYSDTQARNIANSMVGMILAELSDSISWRVNSPATKDLFGGTAVYTVEDAFFAGDSLVKISVTANYSGTTKIVTTYTKMTPPVPPFFGYAALAGTDFIMNGQDNSIADCNNPSWNANVHANNVILNGANFGMEGFATYTGSITADWGDVTISPNQNPDGDPVHYNAPAVDIPSFNLDDYLSIADVVHAGDKTYSGNIILGTQDDPTIIYVGGKLNITGTITGYGIFIVKNDVEVTGNIIVAPADPSGSKLGIYTEKKFIVNSENAIVHAQIFAEDIVLNANGIEIHGSVTSRSSMTLNGQGVEICYKPASGYLTEPFWDGGSESDARLVALYYYE